MASCPLLGQAQAPSRMLSGMARCLVEGHEHWCHNLFTCTDEAGHAPAMRLEQKGESQQMPRANRAKPVVNLGHHLVFAGSNMSLSMCSWLLLAPVKKKGGGRCARWSELPARPSVTAAAKKR